VAQQNGINMTTYTLEPNGRTCLVTLHGDLVASGVVDLKAALKAHLQAGVEEVSFDLAATVQLDSSGIGLLIATSNTLARQQGRVRILNASPDILQLLQSMRLAARLNASGRSN
jgi:anti-anti-sigma factor